MKDIIVICGPTGVGKTKVSVKLAKRINAEIINADSMQVYKYLNIGTAKIKEEEKEGIKHHLFDIAEIKDIYTIYDYQKDCRNKIKEILAKGKKVIITGGSGLYIRAALYDYKLEKEKESIDYSNLTNEELYKKVKEKDSNCEIHPNNRKRLERFLNKEIIEKQDSKPLYNFDIIGLTTDRNNLYNIINKRVDKMLEEGLIEEVKYFFDNQIESKAINTGIGYKELYKYFKNEITKEEAIELIKTNSRRYAKRQYTFFNNQFNVKWFETNYEDIDKTIEEIYNYIEG